MTSAARPGTPLVADQAAALTGSDRRADACVETRPAPRSSQARPLRAVEEPREPHRPTGREAGLDRQDRPHLHRAYLLKEGLRLVFRLGYDEAVERSRPGSAGPAAAASPPSSTCSAASSNTRPRSWPRSSTGCPTDASSRQHQDPPPHPVAFGFSPQTPSSR